ncbi:hypothetical protein [Dokdonella ginsengisoli]|uniref:META domain-containing protein n=1 Tax=Dokdonella ginsengisoli TaxID=363846 RepID=A0ABV9QYQ1_9GAMM
MSSSGAFRRLQAWLAWAGLIPLLVIGREVPAQSDADDPAVLEGHNWYLAEAHTSKGESLPVFTPPNAEPIVLRFHGRSLAVTGCNTLGEGYVLANGRIVQSRSEQDLVTRTARGCEARRGMADDAILVLFNGDPRYRLVPPVRRSEGPRLVLESPADMTVVFRGEPTAEKRFGSKGETIYFDIAPQAIRCALPGRPVHDCLQVRQLFEQRDGSYLPDRNEVPAGQAGPWQLLYDGIEGVNPQEGRESGWYVGLRRFRREGSETGAPYAYVLFGR